VGVLRSSFGRERAAGRRLAVLFAAESPAVFRFAYHVSGNREDAEDLVQTAFLELHRQLARGDEPANPRAWLVVVVKRRAFNLRRDRREAPSDRMETLAGSAGDAPDAVAQLATVRATLWSLPEAQHQAFVLRHWSGLSYEEIAGVLNTTPAAVESLLVRARAAVMAEDGADEACMAVRARLCEGASLAPPQLQHLETCRRCSAAGSRLATATGIAAAMLLVPRAHVAQALASTIPGFTAKAALGGAAASGAGTSGAAAAGAGKAGLAAKAAIAAVALAGTAGAVHSHLGWPAASPTRALDHPTPLAATSIGSTASVAPDRSRPVPGGTVSIVDHRDPTGGDRTAGSGGGDARSSDGGATSSGSDGGTTTGGSDGGTSTTGGSGGQGTGDQGSGPQQSDGGDSSGGGSGGDSSGDGTTQSQDSTSSSDTSTGGGDA
jgi:RNA polymerase sigma-70 factor (ECF subfamily)